MTDDERAKKAIEFMETSVKLDAAVRRMYGDEVADLAQEYAQEGSAILPLELREYQARLRKLWQEWKADGRTA